MREFTYADIKDAWRRTPRLIPACIAAFLVAAFLWLNLVTPKFTGEMVIGPVSRHGVAARGIRLPLQAANDEKIRDLPSELADDETLSDFARVMQLLTSPEIAAALLADKNLAIEEKLLPHHGVKHALKTAIWWIAGQRVGNGNDATTLSHVLAHDLHIEPVGRSAMRRITLRHPDRAFAMRFLNALYHTADSHLRLQAQQRTAAETDYLRHALQSVTQNDQRRALGDLLAAQEQIRLLLSVDLPFAADQIEQAHAPQVADWPNVGLTLFLALCLGIFVGVSALYAQAVRAWLNASA